MFDIIKFRTVPASVLRWIEEDPEKRSITGPQTKKTWAGKIILNWYLDELPQLINVIKGEMAIVGPRPHILRQHNEGIALGMTYRNYLKAGILGVSQACKRDPMYAKAIEKMAKKHCSSQKELRVLDGFYAKECLEKTLVQIVLFDIALIARGIRVVLRGQGK